jgi:hypothetical protein
MLRTTSSQEITDWSDFYRLEAEAQAKALKDARAK